MTSPSGASTPTTRMRLDRRWHACGEKPNPTSGNAHVHKHTHPMHGTVLKCVHMCAPGPAHGCHAPAHRTSKQHTAPVACHNFVHTP
eukprot:343245-Chlamydomonas_euryale.AAC.4